MRGSCAGQTEAISCRECSGDLDPSASPHNGIRWDVERGVAGRQYYMPPAIRAYNPAMTGKGVHVQVLVLRMSFVCTRMYTVHVLRSGVCCNQAICRVASCVLPAIFHLDQYPPISAFYSAFYRIPFCPVELLFWTKGWWGW